LVGSQKQSKKNKLNTVLPLIERPGILFLNHVSKGHFRGGWGEGERGGVERCVEEEGVVWGGVWNGWRKRERDRMGVILEVIRWYIYCEFRKHFNLKNWGLTFI